MVGITGLTGFWSYFLDTFSLSLWKRGISIPFSLIIIIFLFPAFRLVARNIAIAVVSH